MKSISDSEFATFLSEKPLYYKVIAASNFSKGTGDYAHPEDFNDKPFRFKCPVENELQTFRTKICGGTFYNYPELDLSGSLPLYFNPDTRSLDLTLHVLGVCKSCGSTIDFLIKTVSNKTWDDKPIDILIQKVGQYPSFDITPDKNVEKYLTKDDLKLYKKALANLSISYGIGAYAYFRRIIENEIIRIISDISTMDFDGANDVKHALRAYEKDHQMSNLIAVLNQFIPISLRELGDNPIKLLHDQLSGGIHSFTEDDCLKKAESIDKILTFVIRKVKEEKLEIASVREAMKYLRK